MPVFWGVSGQVWACREEGRGPGGAPGWTNDLEAGPSPGSRWTRPGTAMGLCEWRAPWAGRVLGRLAAAFIPSGVPAAGGRGGMGRVRVRAAGSIRQAAGPPGAGASKTSDHALPASGPAHAAFRAAAGQGADLAVAHRVEHPGEQLAGRGDLGDVRGLLAAAGMMSSLRWRSGWPAGTCWIASISAHRTVPGSLLGDVPAADLDIGLPVPGGQPGPRAQPGWAREPGNVADLGHDHRRRAPGRCRAGPGWPGSPRGLLAGPRWPPPARRSRRPATSERAQRGHLPRIRLAQLQAIQPGVAPHPEDVRCR